MEEAFKEYRQHVLHRDGMSLDEDMVTMKEGLPSEGTWVEDYIDTDNFHFEVVVTGKETVYWTRNK